MAAVAPAPAPPSLAGPSVPRPTSAASATSQTKRSTSVTSKKGSEPPAGPPGLSITVEEVKEEIKEGSKSPEPATVPEPAPASLDPSGSPSKSIRPPIRPIPAVRSKFDLEPNPFEQSFRVSHRSDSLDDVNDSAGIGGRTPPRGGDATAIKHNALPPLSSLTSPAAADPSQFPWLANQSLRAGPLSPAMLAGPQGGGNGTSKLGQGNGHGHLAEDGNGMGHGHSHAGDEGGFDQSTFRTGFTPGTGSGFTPSFTSLMGGANFSNLPLPSPNTAAFLNMVTNATPTEGDTSQQQTGAGGQQGPSALPPHLQHHGLSHISSQPTQQDTITPNTLSALTGAVNDMNRQQSQSQLQHGQQLPGNPHMHGQHGAPPPHGGPHHSYYNQHLPPPGYALPPGLPHVDYAQQSANAASQAANGLFLLSQAHQELSKREEEGRGPGAEPVGPGGPGQGHGQGQGGPQMNIPGMGGMAPGAAHAHGGQPQHPGHPQHPNMMGYPGHQMAGHGMPGSGMQATLNHPHPHSHLGGVGAGAPQGLMPGQPPQNPLQGMPGTVKRDSGSLKGANAEPTNGAQAGQKRKSDAADLATAPGGKGKKGKKGAAAAAIGASPPVSGGKKPKNGAPLGIKGESTSPSAADMGMSFNTMNSISGMGMGMGMMDDDDDEDGSEHDGISKITGKPETEEEKRKNFLERNRQAALKCRQRKKQWLNELQTKVEQLQMDNDRLNQTVAGLHDEIGRLSGVLMQHRDCGLGLPTGYGRPIR